jgi:hypothetical protein
MLSGDPLQQVGAPAADDDGVTPGLQLGGEGQTNAAGGAGDEDFRLYPNTGELKRPISRIAYRHIPNRP